MQREDVLKKAFERHKERCGNVSNNTYKLVSKLSRLPVSIYSKEDFNSASKTWDLLLKKNKWVPYIEETEIMFIGESRGKSIALIRGNGRLSSHGNYPHSCKIRVLTGRITASIQQNIHLAEEGSFYADFVFYENEVIDFKATDIMDYSLENAIAIIQWEPELEKVEVEHA